MELVFMPQWFFFAIWLQLTFYVFYRGAIHGDVAHDMPKQLKVWEFWEDHTRPATKVIVFVIISWIMMWPFLGDRISLGVSL